MLAVIIYIISHIMKNDYKTIDLMYAAIMNCFAMLCVASMSLLMFKKSDRMLIGYINWFELFSYSQLLSNFIPGIGVVYRATYLRSKMGITIKKSSAALIRTSILTLILLSLVSVIMYWQYLFIYQGIIKLFLIFFIVGFTIFLLFREYFFIQIKNIRNEMSEDIQSGIDKFRFKPTQVILFIVIFAFSAITTSAAYFYLVTAQYNQISAFDSANIFVTMKALSFAPSLIPANFGLQEFILIGLNRLANIGIDDVIFFSLVIRVMNLVSNLLIVAICKGLKSGLFMNIKN
jgi:hypothetical protein